jgi:hypothetical protein
VWKSDSSSVVGECPDACKSSLPSTLTVQLSGVPHIRHSPCSPVLVFDGSNAEAYTYASLSPNSSSILIATVRVDDYSLGLMAGCSASTSSTIARRTDLRRSKACPSPSSRLLS